jgi:hypothetical protein
MPSKPIELPPRVAKTVRDMRAFFKAKNQLKQDEIASRKQHALASFQRPREKKLRLADVKEMFLGNEGSRVAKCLAELEKYSHQMANHYWRFQGRINAMELVATLATINFAKTQPDPFQFVQDYVESMRQTSSSLLPEVDDPNNADRL